MKLKNILFLLTILFALGAFFYYTSQPKTAPPPESKIYVWSIDQDAIKHITIDLPREGESQSYTEAADRTWHFDDPQQSPVDIKRWGGGITLLLSGPGADRILFKDAAPQKLTELGLTQPQMLITLNLKDGSTLEITVGDKTPSGDAYYVQAPGTNDVASVASEWYKVISDLVTNPPYVVNQSS